MKTVTVQLMCRFAAAFDDLQLGLLVLFVGITKIAAVWRIKEATG